MGEPLFPVPLHIFMAWYLVVRRTLHLVVTVVVFLSFKFRNCIIFTMSTLLNSVVDKILALYSGGVYKCDILTQLFMVPFRFHRLIMCWYLKRERRGLPYKAVSKSFRTGRLEWELQMIQHSAIRCSCIAILWVILISFVAITLGVASQWVFIVVYFVIDSVRKLLDTSSYLPPTQKSWSYSCPLWWLNMRRLCKLRSKCQNNHCFLSSIRGFWCCEKLVWWRPGFETRLFQVS
jgi:hypothetical protein